MTVKLRPWLVPSVLLVAVSFALLHTSRLGLSARASGAASAPPVPVIATEVRLSDVPIFLTGLGTVHAFNSVILRSRVDGQIIKVNFVEGQEVKARDVLVEIDPAPYEAALAQAQATKL